jgi:hypothetical protein
MSELDLRASQLRRGDVLLGSGFVVAADSYVNAHGKAVVVGRYPKQAQDLRREWNARSTIKVERAEKPAAPPNATDATIDARLNYGRGPNETIPASVRCPECGGHGDVVSYVSGEPDSCPAKCASGYIRCERCEEAAALVREGEVLCRRCANTQDEYDAANDLRDAAIEHQLDEHKRRRDERDAPDIQGEA